MISIVRGDDPNNWSGTILSCVVPKRPLTRGIEKINSCPLAIMTELVGDVLADPPHSLLGASSTKSTPAAPCVPASLHHLWHSVMDLSA